MLPLNNKYRFLLFCHEYNDVCISTNITLQDYIKNNKNKLQLEIELIDEQTDNVKFKRYKIGGVPTLLIFKNQRIVKRWLGEITYDKIESVMLEIFDDKLEG